MCILVKTIVKNIGTDLGNVVPIVLGFHTNSRAHDEQVRIEVSVPPITWVVSNVSLKSLQIVKTFWTHCNVYSELWENSPRVLD